MRPWSLLAGLFPILLAYSAPEAAAPVAAGPSQQSGKVRHVAVLEPVDLGTMACAPEWGRVVRGVFADLPAWRLMPLEKMDARLREFRIDPAAPCHEFQCAFDAGNVLLTEFVLYMASTPVGGWQAFTLNIVHVPSAQVVFSRAGEVRRGAEVNPGEALEIALQKLLADIDPSALKTGKREKKGLITVLDIGPGLAASRVLADRLSTHLHATRLFDIMTQAEQRDLLAALEIDKSGYRASDSGMIRLGGKMGVSHLLASRLHQEPTGYRLSLTLYDVRAGRKLRDWPSRSREDVRALFLSEEKFFSGLFGDPVPDPFTAQPEEEGANRAWYRVGAGLGMAVSAAAAYASLRAFQDSDRQYALYQASMSSRAAESHRKRVESRDRDGLALGGASAFLLALSAVSLTFSF